jgi:hypothetical protein
MRIRCSRLFRRRRDLAEEGMDEEMQRERDDLLLGPTGSVAGV